MDILHANEEVALVNNVSDNFSVQKRKQNICFVAVFFLVGLVVVVVIFVVFGFDFDFVFVFVLVLVFEIGRIRIL